MHAGTETPLPVNEMKHRCKDITLPQTSFAGGKYVTFLYRTQEMYDGVLMWILLKGQIATPPTKKFGMWMTQTVITGILFRFFLFVTSQYLEDKHDKSLLLLNFES